MKPVIAFVLGVGVVVGAYYGLPRFLIGNDEPAKADAVVVLAGGERSKHRLEEGLRLLAAGYATNLVVSGVEFDPNHHFFDKATWELLSRQFGVTRVMVDPRSVMTQESARFAAKLGRERGWTRVLVVTSSYHWRRSRWCFRHELDRGVDVRVCTINDQRYELWWCNSCRRSVVLHEYYGLAHFLFAGSLYGLSALAVAGLAGVVVWRVRR